MLLTAVWAVPSCFAHLQHHCSPVNITLCMDLHTNKSVPKFDPMDFHVTHVYTTFCTGLIFSRTLENRWLPSNSARCLLAVQAGPSSYEDTENSAKPSRNATEMCSSTRAPALQLAILQYPGVLLCLKTQYRKREDLKCHEFRVHASTVYSKTFSQVS